MYVLGDFVLAVGMHGANGNSEIKQDVTKSEQRGRGQKRAQQPAADAGDDSATTCDQPVVLDGPLDEQEPVQGQKRQKVNCEQAKKEQAEGRKLASPASLPVRAPKHKPPREACDHGEGKGEEADGEVGGRQVQEQDVSGLPVEALSENARQDEQVAGHASQDDGQGDDGRGQRAVAGLPRPGVPVDCKDRV